MYYLVKGEGPILVLLHGYCDDHTIWEKVDESLLANFKLIMPDMPGFGKSEICRPQTVEAMADKLKVILDAEQVRQAVVVGHSMGGYVALAFAEKYPEYLAGLGLFHSNAIADTDEKKENRNKTIEFVENNGVEPFARTFVPNLFATGFNNKQVLEDTFVKANNCTKEAVIETAKALRDRPDRTKVLEEITCPVLFLAGKTDNIVPYSLIMQHASLPKLSSIYPLNNVGHMGMLESPEKTIEYLTEFTQFCFARK